MQYILALIKRFSFSIMMKLFYALSLLLSTATMLLGANVYVSMGSFNSPYYEFYSDSAGTVPLASLDVNETYTFYRLANAPTHPFYISDVGYEETSSSKITLSGDGSANNGITGTQNFTLSFNGFDPSSDTLYFYCTAHSSMLNQFSFAATLPLVGTSSLFEDTSNATWIRVLQTTNKNTDAENSQSEQVIVMNITSMPEGSRYRVAKTTSNNQWYMAPAKDLSIGLNTITVGAVNFNRTVKIQFDQGGIEFDSLSVNGVSLYGEGGYTLTAPSGSVLASSVFSAGTGAYPYAYASTTAADGTASQAEQTFILNVTALPEGGANYSIYKTTENGNDDEGSPVALELGTNVIPAVAAVQFDRTVKLRLSADVAIDEFFVNGDYVVGSDGNTVTAPTGSVLASSVFSTGNNEYPFAHTSTSALEDGAASQAEQTFILNVTALPENGASYSIFKTTANGYEDTSNPVSLVLGTNTITRPAVDFDRTMKLRLSKDVAIDTFIVNGEYIVGEPFLAPEGSVLASTLFDLNSNANYPYLWTLTTTEDGVSGRAAQTMILNVTALPEGGANYSVYKTVSNGQGDAGSQKALSLGLNPIAVSAVDFDRAVKIRLTDDVAIDSLAVNGIYQLGSAPVPPVGSVYPDENFDLVSNVDWPYAYTAANSTDGASSQAAFQFLINITELPDGGATRSIAKTLISGPSDWYYSDPVDLVLGVNRFTVPAVEFDRTVKLRLSSDQIAYEYFGVNRTNVYGTPLDSDSDGVNDWEDYSPNDPNVQVEPPAVAPALSISSDGANVTIEWSDSAGFEVKSSDDLNTWTSTGDSESPYTESIGTTKFYKLSNE